MNNFDLKSYLSNNKLLLESTFTPDELKILDSKISPSLREGIYETLDDIYNTEEKKEELFSQTIDKYNNVISDYANLVPSTPLEKKLFEATTKGQGSRADNIGPGELFVVLTTKNTVFGTVGDINSNGKEIEIKKSKGTELNITYTAGGVYKFFPILKSLNSLVDNLEDTLQEYRPEYKSLSPNSRLLYKYLVKGFNDLKIDPKKEFEGSDFIESFQEYKPLFSLKRNDFIEGKIDESFIDDVIRDIERKIEKLKPEDYMSGFQKALKEYFGKGFDYILFYKGSSGNYTASLIEMEGVEDNVDIERSTVRNGYQIYIRLKKEILAEAETYSSGEKLQRGYGLTSKFITFIYKGLNKLLSILK